MKRAALLLAAMLTLGLAAACGSDSPTPEPTPSASRADREAEQTQQQEQMVAEAAEAGRRAGVAMARNVVGDPEAPVLIVEYSDFQ